jgi:uncharacterized Zn-binding protein involved in type VI secretion
MGAPAARLNDIAIGTCTAHDVPRPFTAVCISGAQTVKADGLPRATINSIFLADCGHTFVAVSGSSTVKLEALGAHRVNDLVINNGIGVTMSGSPKTKTGG